MNSKKITAVILCLALFISCKKEETNNPAPGNLQLQVIVKTATDTPVPGATVKLYPSENDWNSGTNIIQTKTTGPDGAALFSGLNSQRYYWLASDGCLNNGYNTRSTPNPLTANIVNEAETIIDANGSIKLNNTSIDSFRVFINGLQHSEMNGKTVQTIKYKEVGNYNIRVLQMHGYVSTPIDQTYTGAVTCGGTLPITFP